jgi:hypothetical protein
VIVSLPGKILVIELKVNFLEVFFKEYFLEFGFIADG